MKYTAEKVIVPQFHRIESREAFIVRGIGDLEDADKKVIATEQVIYKEQVFKDSLIAKTAKLQAQIDEINLKLEAINKVEKEEE